MSSTRLYRNLMLALVAVLLTGAPAGAQVQVQCPGDLNGDGVPDPFEYKNNGMPDINKPNSDFKPLVSCKHLTAGDGFVTMGDGRVQYMFGFADATGWDPRPSPNDRSGVVASSVLGLAPSLQMSAGG